MQKERQTGTTKGRPVGSLWRRTVLVARLGRQGPAPPVIGCQNSPCSNCPFYPICPHHVESFPLLVMHKLLGPSATSLALHPSPSEPQLMMAVCDAVSLLHQLVLPPIKSLCVCV